MTRRSQKLAHRELSSKPLHAGSSATTLPKAGADEPVLDAHKLEQKFQSLYDDPEAFVAFVKVAASC